MELTHPATGHTVKTTEKSADFWKAAGYEAKKAPAKKATPRKSEK